MKGKLIFALLGLGVAGWFFLLREDPFSRPIAPTVPEAALTYRPGWVEPAGFEARQESPREPFRFRHQGAVFTALADFQVRARVLSKRNYSADREARFSKVDLALGWGPMSETSNLLDISISQDRRFYFWRVQDFPIPREDIENHSANMHLIAASDLIAERLEQVGAGDEILMEGQLVHITGGDGWTWESSLTRGDTGAGACEVVWVSHFEIQVASRSHLGN